MNKTRFLRAFTSMLSVAGLATASAFTDSRLHSSSFQRLRRDDKPAWPYGVVGDSWGSGVSYNNDTLYDNNLDKCLRTKEAHGPQLEADTSWTGDFSSGLRDAACSGSQLVDIATDMGQHQFAKIGNPDMVVMTSGGNNAGFGHIVDVCIYHSDPNHNYGNAYDQDDPNNPTGDCGIALNDASNYINDEGRMKNDLTVTIKNALADDAVKDNKDFLLYLTGYAQFFGTDYDDWCNSETWSILNRYTSRVKLTKVLRQAFNDRIVAVNTLYKSVIGTFANGRYIDLDTGFGGHRFCEPGQTHDDQLNTDTNFDKVYLWNLNWSWQVANTNPPPGIDPNNVTLDQAVQIMGGGQVNAWSGGAGNEPDNGWRLRPFHPRYTGYTSIKEAIIAQMKTDGIPKASPPSGPGGGDPPPSDPGYATGTCSFHLDEYQTCVTDSTNLFAVITLEDNNKAVIGQTDTHGGTTVGDGINANSPLSFNSKLPHPLVVTGEHQGDYVQFNYNGLQFKSTDTACSQGGWDPKQGPSCGRFGNFPAKRQMDCSFPC